MSVELGTSPGSFVLTHSFAVEQKTFRSETPPVSLVRVPCSAVEQGIFPSDSLRLIPRIARVATDALEVLGTHCTYMGVGEALFRYQDIRAGKSRAVPKEAALAGALTEGSLVLGALGSFASSMIQTAVESGGCRKGSFCFRMGRTLLKTAALGVLRVFGDQILKCTIERLLGSVPLIGACAPLLSEIALAIPGRWGPCKTAFGAFLQLLQKR